MKKVKLGELADVIVSGVDKKTKDGETPVKLCNFVDVYYNWAVTSEMYDSFMDASARDAEIDKFSLSKGQVAITKDSETRFDIGIPTYIADDFEGVLLGYHCALITPNQELLNGKYLNALLHSDYAKEYFANNATGSGQRYTISEDTIKTFPVPLIPIEEQEKIGNYLSDIDRKISCNKKQNDLLEKMAKQLYDYWFVQFDFPDENGKPYKSSDGTMVYNEKLKRDIPEGWEVTTLSKILQDDTSRQINPQDTPDRIFKHLSFPSLDSCNSYKEEAGSEIRSNKIVVKENYVLASKLNPWIKRIAWGTNDENLVCSTEFVVMIPNTEALKGYLFTLLNQTAFIDYCTVSSTGTSHSQRRVNPDIMKQYSFPYDESVTLKFSEIISAYIEQQQQNIKQNRELVAVRDSLLPLLMTGQATL